jgi:hypothetical protein
MRKIIPDPVPYSDISKWSNLSFIPYGTYFIGKILQVAAILCNFFFSA